MFEAIKRLFTRKPKLTPDQELFELLATSWMEEEGLALLRVKRLNEVLDRGANPNAVEPLSGYPIWRAAAGEPVLLEVLINRGADIKAANEMDFCFSENPESLRLLLEAGLDPNMEFQGETLIHYLWTLFDEQQGAKSSIQSILDVLIAGAKIEGLSKSGFRKPYAPSVTIESLIKAEKRCVGPAHTKSSFGALRQNLLKNKEGVATP